jgi:hypothetical protein
MEGLRQLLETADIIRMNFQPCYVKILGLLLTFVEDRTLLSRQIQQQMREYFGDLVFDTVIHRTVRLAEAPSAGESILTFAPKSRGAAEYTALVEEILTREEVPTEKTTGEEAGEEAAEEAAEETVEETVEEAAEETGEEAGEETLAEVGSQDEDNTLD